jgi:phytoene dehydrogenase-like protein
MADVAVIGAGFGGLATALTLAEGEARVALFESLKYPGGCASTFTRRGYHFEAGATLFSGFDSGQLFDTWIRRHQLPVETHVIDPIVELRAPGFHLPVPTERARLIERFCSLPGAPVEGIRRYFARQQQVADTLWSLFDDPTLLPPFDLRALLRHAGRLGSYTTLLPLLGQPLVKVMARDGVDDFGPLRAFVDAVCQITVQTSAAEAEAPFALSALDYFFRGTRHVRGGIGELAWGMARAVERLGGELHFADAVRKLERTKHGWRVHSRRGVTEARLVVANVLPHTLRSMLDEDVKAQLSPIEQSVEEGWGAAMLYLVIPSDVPGVRPEAHHLELIADASAPFQEGNHLFVSLSGRNEARGPAALENDVPARRTITVSTHVPMQRLRELGEEEQGHYIAGIQQRMRATLTKHAPEISEAVLFEMTASPRTFERFTRRHLGYVGGVPRRAGLHHYRSLSAPEIARGLFLVGDSVFPGQSTLGTAIGGTRLATRILRREL